MGQTLPNDIYLPAEGERNCYDGLEGNWRSLDSLISTVAGKASATHTHGNITNDGKVGTTANLPLITGTGGAVQAGAFGNQANTFCEGNDSRLSDARTPVAHTHGKADITDLFNSANTWTGANTFSDSSPIRLKNDNIEKGVQPTFFQAQNILFKDKNNSDVANIRHIVTARGTNNNADGLEFSVANKFANGALDPTGTNTVGTLRIGFWTDGQKYIYNEFRWRSSLIPFNNQTQDIGSSSYQWNNLYAKNYYYNGTAWGLDKANTWSAENTFTSNNINIKRPFTLGDNTYQVARLQILDSASTPQRLGTFNFVHDTNNISRLEIGIYGLNSNNEIKSRFLFFQVEPDETSYFAPINSSQINLGTSTNKWKSFNGVNPGALSIFNPSATYDPIDIPNTWDTSGSDWNTLNVSNVGDGWICITYNNCSEGDYILVRFGGTRGNGYPSLRFEAVKAINKYFIYALFPVAKAFGNIYLDMLIGSDANLIMHHYIPSYGTV